MASRFRPRDSRGRWVKVLPPQMWDPYKGDELVGTFEGTITRHGRYGAYDVALIRADRHRYVVSGTHLILTLECGGFEPGDDIRIVYEGLRWTSNEFQMKEFDVYSSREKGCT